MNPSGKRVTSLGLRPLKFLFVWSLGLVAAASAIAQTMLPAPFEWEYMPILQGYSLAYTPDGKTLAVGGFGGIQLINTATRAQRCLTARPNSDFNAVAISPDGKSLALGGNDLEVWSLATGKQIGTLPFSGVMVNSLAYSADGRWLAAAGFSIRFNGPYQPPISSSVVQIYTASTLTPVGSPLLSNGGISNSIAFSKDSQYLLEGGAGSKTPATSGYVSIWNASSGALQGSIATTASSEVNSVALSSDGTQLAVAGSDSTGAVVELGNWQRPSLTRTIPVPSAIQLRSVAWSPNQKLLALSGSQPNVGSNFDTIAVVQTWNPTTGKLIHNFSVSGSANAQAVVFSPDGKTMANCQGTSSSGQTLPTGGFLQFWNSSSSALEASIDTTGSYGSMNVAFSPNSRVVAQPWTSLTGNSIRLLNAANGEMMRSLPSQITTGLGPVTYSPLGGYLADAGIKTTQVGSVSNSTGLIEIRNGITGSTLFSLKSAANVSIPSIGFSKDGSKLAVGGMNAAGGIVELWSVAHRTLIANLRTKAVGAVNCAAVSPDGNLVADGGQDAQLSGILEIWNASSGKLVTSLPTACNSTVDYLSYSPDGKTLAVAGYSATIDGFLVEFWNTSAWSRGKTYTSNGRVDGIAFTPDSKTLLTNWGYSVLALSVEYGVVFAQYADAGFGAVAVSPANDRIVTTDSFGRILAMADNVGSVFWSNGVSISPTSFKGGSSATGTLTLSAPAPAGGLSLQLYVNISGVTITCPTTVVVPAGKKVTTFTLSSTIVTSTTTGVLLIGSNGNYVTAQCPLTVTP